ncbi:putative bifunctional inhibitor/plant lipid transfer protein/seed storage helical [Helianthus annuus]|nr:putative bifunctional inhibitor/plant lipid transfer protein/seed storage helical [Helianthus annuus]
MRKVIVLITTIVALMLILDNVHALDCNPDLDIKACIPALHEGGQPDSVCCTKLIEHKECLCEYINIHHFNRPLNYQYLLPLSAKCDAIGMPVDFPDCTDQ